MSDATAVQAVLATCQQRGIVLAIAGEKLTVDAPEGTLTPDLLADLRQHKAGLVELLKNGCLPTETTGSADPNLPETDMPPWDECIEPPHPCPKCGSLMIWWDVLGGQHCMICDKPKHPREKAAELRKLAVRLRRSARPGSFSRHGR
jgi:hypothetical protein